MSYRKFQPDCVYRHLNCITDQFPDLSEKSSISSGLGILFTRRFKNIIDAIYSNPNPVDLCSALGLSLSEHVSPDVSRFVQNFLLKPIPVAKGAPDNDTALETLIPNDCYTRSRIAPHLDHIENFISSFNTNSSTNA